MRFCRIIFLFILCSFGKAQPFAIGHVQRTFTDPARANRSVPCEIYYPSSQAGESTPFSNGKFPVIAFGHGFVMPWSVYDIYWQKLVPEGFILVFPTTESGFSPSHLNFGKDLAFVCQKLKQEGANQASLFFSHIDSASAVMGHSMGGGAAFLAMEQDSNLSAFVTLAAAETSPSAIAAAGNISRPSLLFSGANDCVTPPPAHQIPMYNALNSSQKSLVSIAGGNHCQFASSNFNCTLGQSTCSPQATINAVQQQGKVFPLLIHWLQFYLKNNCGAGSNFQEIASAGAGITIEQSGILACGTTRLQEVSSPQGLMILFNAASSELIIRRDNNREIVPYTITDALGRLIQSGKLHGTETRENTGHLKKDIYFLRMEGFSVRRFCIW